MKPWAGLHFLPSNGIVAMVQHKQQGEACFFVSVCGCCVMLVLIVTEMIRHNNHMNMPLLNLLLSSGVSYIPMI